jgi:hypothetical protein
MSLYKEYPRFYVPVTEQDYLNGLAYNRKCWYCGKVFYSFYPLRRYCSYRCRNNAYVDRRKKKREIKREKICLHCGQLFKAKRRDAKYCSGGCRVQAHRDRERWINARFKKKNGE